MTNSNKSRWVDYVIFGLSIFLIFCLIFESYIELPRFIAWLGHWHPLVLHFPIVLLLIAIFLGLTGKVVARALLTVATVTALITAVSGFFLGMDAGIKGDLLFWHQWLGGGVALLAAIWYWLDGMQLGQKPYTKILQVVLVLLVGFTGHYGGMVTHGEEFLALPTEKREEKIPENPLIYKDVVSRIFEDKCVSCHNPNKKKGELLMTSLDGLLAGGEVGNAIIPGIPEESEIIRRLHLPFEDEEHMPPEGKQPLDANEIQILAQWIALGASDTLRLNQIEKIEPLVALVEGLMKPNAMERWKKLPKVADSTLNNLASDYLTITRIAGNSDALSVSVFMPPEYDSKSITDLRRVADNIINLDLSGLPIGKAEMDMVANCPNLEWLEVDRTPITDMETDTLKVLSRLRTLKIYNTSITDASISSFKEMSELQQVYLWKTKISKEGLNELKNENTNLLIELGIDPAIQDFFINKDSIQKN